MGVGYVRVCVSPFINHHNSLLSELATVSLSLSGYIKTLEKTLVVKTFTCVFKWRIITLYFFDWITIQKEIDFWLT